MQLCFCAENGTWSGVDYFYSRELLKNISLTTLARLSVNSHRSAFQVSPESKAVCFLPGTN